MAFRKHVIIQLQLILNETRSQTRLADSTFVSFIVFPLDLFKCGACQRNYHELEEFIAHKKTCDVDQDAEESENTPEESPEQSQKGLLRSVFLRGKMHSFTTSSSLNTLAFIHI